MANYQEMSMLDVATSILASHEGKMKMADLLKQTLEAKGIEDKNYEHETQLYLDITTSSRFVYMGEEEWDLKDRQPLAMYDKDGSEFNQVEELELDKEEDTNLTFADEDEEVEESEYEDEDEEYDDDYEDEDEDDDLERDENGDILERYHEDDSDDFDEDKYNDYMDDFEDMYDDN